MGNGLAKWAGRISGLYHLKPLSQCVLLRMANTATDPDAKDSGQPRERRSVCWKSRAALAMEIYGDPGKARYLDRPIADLRRAGLITPEGISSRKGHVQEYRLCIYEAVALQYDMLKGLYPNDAQQLGRIIRMFEQA